MKYARLGIAAILLLAVPSASSRLICAIEQDNFDYLMGAASDDVRRNLIDFVLIDKEGMFRYDCHKRMILLYVDSQTNMGKSVEFDRTYLKFYIGNYMEVKFRNMNYNEAVRYIAVDVATRLYDSSLVNDAEKFYAYEPDSLKIVRRIANRIHTAAVTKQGK